MTDPKGDAFIINIKPPQSHSHSAKFTEVGIAKNDVLYGRDTAMDHHSLGDTESTASSKTKAIITEEEQRKPSKLPLWLHIQVTKFRTSRTRQAILAFFFIVAAVLLGVLIWLETRGHLHEIFKVSARRKIEL